MFQQTIIPYFFYIISTWNNNIAYGYFNYINLLGLECFECISYGNEGDSTCETPIVGVTNIVPCSNADDYNVAAKEFLTKWDTLITKIQKQLGGIRAKRNGNNNYNKTVETDQPACVKFSFMSKQSWFHIIAQLIFITCVA